MPYGFGRVVDFEGKCATGNAPQPDSVHRVGGAGNFANPMVGSVVKDRHGPRAEKAAERVEP